MPELPDVEKHRRLAERTVAGARVEAVEVPDPQLLVGTSPQGVGRSLSGRVLDAAQRRGKWLLLPAGGPTLVVHFRMTGELAWSTDDEDHPDDRLRLVVASGRLAYRSRRRLGRVWYLPDGADPSQVTGPLGPDALAIDRDELAGRLADKRGGLKSALMDQALVAGLGNELVDEILWRAGIDPRRRARELDADELKATHRALRAVLTRSVRAGHVPSGPTWLNAQRDADDPRCPACGRPLTIATVAGRTTFWCETDQPRQ